MEGSSAVPITLTVDTTEGTAEGIKPSQGIPVNEFVLCFLGSEYNLTQPAELVLFAGENRTCTFIMTTDDEIYEADESFFTTLTSTNEGVVITISSAAILITDDDGMYMFPS